MIGAGTLDRATRLAAFALVLVPAAAGAQAVNGTAEVSMAQNVSTSNTQSYANNTLWQNYTFGYASALWDPRLVTYNTEVLFRTSRLAAGGTGQADQQGHENDLGFKLGASLFPESAFPFYVQATRVNNGSSGDLGPSSPIRSGLIDATGTPPADVNSLNTLFNVGGQVNLGEWPRVQLSYRKGATTSTSGSYLAEQHTEDLSANVTKDTRRTRQSLRYQRSAFDGLLTGVFSQRLNNLDYDFETLVSEHTRLLAHAGRRTTFSHAELSSPVADPGGTPYQPPPSDGAGSAYYTSGGLSYEPSVRLTVRMTGSVDWQNAAEATTSARLLTTTSRYEVLRGLSLTAAGILGTRQQILENSLVTVATRSGTGGLTYQAGPRWLYINVGATRGFGTNTTPEGVTGASQSWSAEAGLSSTVRWLGLGLGYERANNRDQVLDLGNYSTERIRASLQAQASRLSLSTSADQVRIARGVAAAVSRNLQRTLSVAASYRAWRESLFTATAGGFSNDYTNPTGPGRDRSLFWSAGSQISARRTLRLAGSVRGEWADATSTHFNQYGLSYLGRFEYRFRTTNFALEYRRNASRARYLDMVNPDNFEGRQIRISVLRQFGFRL